MECWCTAFVNDQCFISNSLMNASLHVWSQITNPHHYFVSFRNNTLSYDYPNCNSLAFILYSYQVVEKKRLGCNIFVRSFVGNGIDRHSLCHLTAFCYQMIVACNVWPTHCSVCVTHHGHYIHTGWWVYHSHCPWKSS